MGKLLIIKNADFSNVAVNKVTPIPEGDWINNAFAWGKGGINEPGKSSGSTNFAMSMIGLPLEQANSATILKASNGYRIFGVLIADVANPSWEPSAYNYVQYDDASTAPATVTIPADKYYEITICTLDGSNADITEGAQSLLINV